MLDAHILHLHGDQVAVPLGFVDDQAGMLRVNVELDQVVIVHEHGTVPSPFDELVQGAHLAFALVICALFHDALGTVRIGDLRLRQSGSSRLAVGDRVLLRRRNKPAFEHFVHGIQNPQKAVAASVHYAGLLQLGQLFRRLVQSSVSSGDGSHEQRLKISLWVDLHQLRSTFGCRPHNRQDGAFGGVHDRLISALDASIHGAGKLSRPSALLLLQGTRYPTEKDGEDNAGIAAGAAQHILCRPAGAGTQRHSRIKPEVIDPAHGHGHIRTGIPIGHRKHVHIVDGLAVGGQEIGSAAQHLIISFSR